MKHWLIYYAVILALAIGVIQFEDSQYVISYHPYPVAYDVPQEFARLGCKNAADPTGVLDSSCVLQAQINAIMNPTIVRPK